MAVDSTPELMLVMPVFNEQASVRKVVLEWFAELGDWTENFVFLALDDGSTDGTPKILNRLREQLGPRLEIHRHSNRGHGQTCLEGYRIAAGRGIPFVLQIDSDGQCDPQYFFRFWRQREKADVIYGQRKVRDDGWRRRVASIILRVMLLAVRGTWCEDANVPYRLMRTVVISPFLKLIPADFFLANIALATLLKKNPAIRHEKVPIHFRERYGGEPHVPLTRFGDKALELITQLRALPR
jgi:dolichol-phosphate mannosyltransferase